MKRGWQHILAPLPDYVRQFVKADFHWQKYLAIGIFLAISLFVNYRFEFETRFVNTTHFGDRFVRYILFYGFAYLTALALLRLTSSSWKNWRLPGFWWLLAAGVVIIAFSGSARGTYELARQWFGSANYLYQGRVMAELRGMLTTLLPLWLLWWTVRKHYDSFFGLTTNNLIIRPYLWLLAAMLPPIAVAATSPAFLQTYPMCRLYGAADYWQVPKGWLAAVYELAYASGFLSTELFFRGFLVIGLVRFLGKDTVLPMVCMYAFLHFEKPLGEAIGSIFGGYLLGIFAYYSGNIWGGVILHVGVAMLMEGAAWLAGTF